MIVWSGADASNYFNTGGEILRAVWFAYTHANSDSYRYSNAYCHTDSDGNSHADKAYTDAKTAAHAGAASIRRFCKNHLL